ncbi:GntR family transcriptional regulator [Rubrivivax gelatinosus]|uniref:GntR family transcriptional regulator n=1 Tax=Rubrivivax gelatinosus TaxID=28068 RepID=A0ABS1DZT9_RUBGE|nr:GntR family transcriptional regulator [Rubrivivax gelatinosus]MBK1715626.1 GntR family transcriptional regulator [Rubrivivax gelatinosus]
MPRRPAEPLPLAPDEAPKRAHGAGATTQQIVDTITTAIVERRLMPGTKLAEQAVADLFGVSRTLVREALNRLSRDRLVTLEPARGAFVARPSVDEARQVFEARRLLETGMVRELCASARAEDLEALRAHLHAEADAVLRHDVAGRTRLLGHFHVLLAQRLDNAVLAELLADLLSRCSLIALMYQSADAAGHSQDEHVLIVDAIDRRDAEAASRLMAEHLGNVVGNLQRHPRVGDLADVLRPAA